jgi:hypothetical protein
MAKHEPEERVPTKVYWSRGMMWVPHYVHPGLYCGPGRWRWARGWDPTRCGPDWRNANDDLVK